MWLSSLGVLLLHHTVAYPTLDWTCAQQRLLKTDECVGSSATTVRRSATSAGAQHAANLPSFALRHNYSAPEFNYAVLSRIYEDAPQLLVITLRGYSKFGHNGSAGLTVLNVSNPAAPKIHARWRLPRHAEVEGQDRIGDLLVIGDMANGGLWIFNVSHNLRAQYENPVAYLKVPGDKVLHAKLAVRPWLRMGGPLVSYNC